MEWLVPFVTIAVTAAIETAVVFYVNTALKKYAKKIDDKREAERKDAERAELEAEALKGGVQALLRCELYKMHASAAKAGYATLGDKNEFENMYRKYHALGKNGVMDAVYEEYMGLPDHKQKKGEKK